MTVALIFVLGLLLGFVVGVLLDDAIDALRKGHS